MAAKKGQSSEDLRNASAQKNCCSIFKPAQNFAKILKKYGKALACSLAASNLPVKIRLTRKLRLLVAAYRLRRSAKRVLLAIERYDDRALFEALERFRKARGYYFRLVASCEGSGNSNPISEQVSEILGYHLIVSLVDAWKTLRPLKEDYQASLETLSALKKGQNSNPRVCLDALRACITADVIINVGLDLACQLMTANLPLEEKLKFIKEVFPEFKRMVDAEINNAGLSYRKTWGGLLSLAKTEAVTELSRNSKNQEISRGRNFLDEIFDVYEALLTATLREAAKKAREGEVPETPPRAGSSEQVAKIFYRYKNGGPQKHRTSSTREPYN
jgi:hypothetical protein